MTREEILQYAWAMVHHFDLKISRETIQLLPESILNCKIRSRPFRDLYLQLLPYEELERKRKLMIPKPNGQAKTTQSQRHKLES